ncbi:MAG: YfiR family protein [Pseudomonadota bacterium]
MRAPGKPSAARPAALARALARALLALAVAGASLSAAPPALAQAAQSGALERSVKAAFLYKFLAYAQFAPSAFADAEAPVTIGVLGADEMASELSRVVAGRKIERRAIAVRALREGDPLEGVQLLFLAGADEARVAAQLRGAAHHALLTVTQTDSGLQDGSVINFRIIDERVRFEVSLEAAARNGVALSSRLLSVAYLVARRAP